MQLWKTISGASERALGSPPWQDNLPNRITATRFAFGASATAISSLADWQIAFFVFVGFVFSDWLDGFLAKRNGGRLQTEWGKFNDPAADKLTCLPLLLLVWFSRDLPTGYLPPLAFIIGYDFLVMHMRRTDKKMRTNKIAKVKQVAIFVAIAIPLAEWSGFVHPILPPARCGFALWDTLPGWLAETLTNYDVRYCEPEGWGEMTLWLAGILAAVSMGLYLWQRYYERLFLQPIAK